MDEEYSDEQWVGEPVPGEEGMTYAPIEDDIDVHSICLDGQRVLVVSIQGHTIDRWFVRGLDRVVLQIDEGKAPYKE